MCVWTIRVYVVENFHLQLGTCLPKKGERGGGCVCDGHSKDKHACLSRSFVLSNSNASTSFYFHTHTHTDAEQTKWASAKERKRSVCFVLSVCESVGDLSLTLFLRLHLPIMKCIQIHPRNQLVCLFCMFVTLVLPFSCLFSFNDSCKLPPNCCCAWVFFSFSLNRLQAHTKYKKKEAKKNAEKQTLYRKLFLFWTLTQSYDDFVLLPHLREWDARRRAGTGRRSFSLSHSLSCSHTRTRTCFRSVLLTRSRDKCFVSGQIKIMKQARILFNCTRT